MSLEEIKKLLGNEKLIIGTDKVVKNLNTSNVVKVFVASNFSGLRFDDVKHFASISGAELEVLAISNEELGVICKKPFSVSVIGLLK